MLRLPRNPRIAARMLLKRANLSKTGYGTTHGFSYFKTYSTVLPLMTRFE